MPGACPLVSVVIPARNASETVIETLKTVSGQTYGELDIIVIDDGSTDGTRSLVEAYARTDPRVRLIEQANGGVASARNAGIRASRADFVAFVDADDLWHATKIQKQMAELRAGGADLALVYCPHRVIDRCGNVVASSPSFGADGWVLHRHFHVNLVGNGSAILVRKEALERIGGFSLSLRAAGAEGCEDLLLQLRLAARYRFATVNEYLVGYRRRPGNMSSDTSRMIRSGILAIRAALAESRHIPDLSASALLNSYEWRRLKVAILSAQFADAVRIASRQIRKDPAFPIMAALKKAVVLTDRIRACALGIRVGGVRAVLSRGLPLRHFDGYSPEEGIRRTKGDVTARALARLADRDGAYRPSSSLADGDDMPPGAGIESMRSMAPSKGR